MNNLTTQDESYKNLLFVDQSLEQLVTQYNPPNDLFIEAYQYVVNNELNEAQRTLKTILINPASEIRTKLWAWKSLRDLGEIPSIDTKDEVQGVVFEIPTNDWVDFLAVYSDSRVRYLNGKAGINGLIVWEATDNLHIQSLVNRVINSAKTIVGKVPTFEKHLVTSPSVQPRISVLTYAGIYIIERERNNAYITDPVLSDGMQLFLGLMQEVEKNKM